ncbi:MAG: transporter substrate-binding domain-containing protein [Ruminococcaceae bacterium]|nr:transporter substrate-binding domain-containing protein [Oscillospiraceae bacterium]
MKRKNAIILTILLIFSILITVSCGKKKDDNILRVGMECGYAPYNWSQSDDSNDAAPIADSKDFANGYDVMMAKYLADKMDMTVVVYKIDWDALPVALQSGKVDCVIAGQSITSDRLETVDFTTPYYYASIVTLIKQDSKYGSAESIQDFAGAKATSQLNTVWYDVLDQIPQVNMLPPMETVPNLLIALDSGKVDLIVVDLPTAMAALEVYPDFKMMSFGETGGYDVSEEEINIGISVKKGNSELLNSLNEGLKTLTTDDFDSFMKKAIEIQPLSNIE